MGNGPRHGVVLKVSILSPMSRVPGPESVVTGKHGVMVRVRGRTGVFLPEVAAEYGWTAEQTLDRLCSEKMFLSADAWRTPGAEIFVFTTQTFEESEPGKTAEG